MRIVPLVVGPLQTNCYLVSNQKKDCVVIDPGEDGLYIAEKINELELTPVAMLATHGHHDHIGGATTLKMIFDLSLYISQEDIELLERARSTSFYFSKLDPGPKTWDVSPITKTDEIVFSDMHFKTIKLPGHTKGGLGFQILDNLFSGDILFADGTRGESNHRYSDPIQLSSSVKKVQNFKGIVWPGHGSSFRPEEILLA